jgi:hypothetical protein
MKDELARVALLLSKPQLSGGGDAIIRAADVVEMISQ